MLISNWVGFNSENLPIMLEKLNLREDDRKNIIDESEHQQIVCAHCNTSITKENIGLIVPGSKKIYCKNVSCLADYVIKNSE